LKVEIRQKDFCRTFPTETLPRPGIEFQRNLVKLLLRKHGKIRPLLQVLAQQSIGILVDAALPGAMGISKIDFDARP